MRESENTLSLILCRYFFSYAFSFIRLADYLIVNTMHVLAVNSVSTLLNYLTEQLQTTPPLAEIQDYNKVPYHFFSETMVTWYKMYM